MRENW